MKSLYIFRWNVRKTSLASSQNRQVQRPLSMIETSKCQTMFSRTTGSTDLSNNVQSFGVQTFPNCGTYFFKHISDGEEDELDRASIGHEIGIRGIGKVEEIESDANCNNVVILPPLPDDDDEAFEEVSLYFCYKDHGYNEFTFITNKKNM